MNNDDIINLGEADMVPLASQLHQTIRAGLPLESGLRVLAEQTRRASARAALLDLSRQLEQGTPLSDALRACSAKLPRSMRTLVSVGLEEGQLPPLMQYCIEREGRANALRRQIWLTLFYPLFLVWSAWVLCGAIQIFVVPIFRKTFDDFGTELPRLTTHLFGLSSFVLNAWLLWAIVALGYWIVVGVLTGTTWGQRQASRLPLISHIFRYAALNDLCSILALFIESDIPFERAVRSAGEATDNIWMKRQCQTLATSMEQGTPSATAAARLELPNGIIHAIQHASHQQRFADSLRELSEIYRAQCLAQAEHFNAIVAPYSVGIVMSMAVISETGLILPMIKLLNDMS